MSCDRCVWIIETAKQLIGYTTSTRLIGMQLLNALREQVYKHQSQPTRTKTRMSKNRRSLIAPSQAC